MPMAGDGGLVVQASVQTTKDTNGLRQYTPIVGAIFYRLPLEAEIKEITEKANEIYRASITPGVQRGKVATGINRLLLP